jgi:hypothetical protein
MRAGQNRCITTSPVHFIEQTFYRTGVLVNRLIELVFGCSNFSGLWIFCEFPNWHLTELVFYNEHKIELVFAFGRAAAAHPHTRFFCEFWAYAAYAKFSQNLRPSSTYIKNLILFFI